MEHIKIGEFFRFFTLQESSLFPFSGQFSIMALTIQVSFNPLSPDIKMHVLLTVLHTFLMELVKRICLHINTS